MQVNLENAAPEFKARFRRHEEELGQLYEQLYPGDETALRYFISMLFRAWQERPDSLKEIDRACEQNPFWYKDRSLTGMLMYTDAFAKNLRGVMDHLDYLADCGAIICISCHCLRARKDAATVDMRFRISRK